MLRWADPPHISLASPLHLKSHLPGWLALLMSSLPQKHWPPYSVPAYFAPRESQCSTQLLDEVLLPQYSICFPRERGFTVSRKQPAAFQTPDVLLTEAGFKPEEDPLVEDDPVSVGPEVTGAGTAVSGDLAPAQLVALVARPGPGWIGLQPGSAFNAPLLPMSCLTTGAIVHASLSASLCTEPAPKHCGESRGSPVLPMSQPLMAFARTPGFHPFNYM